MEKRNNLVILCEVDHYWSTFFKYYDLLNGDGIIKKIDIFI